MNPESAKGKVIPMTHAQIRVEFRKMDNASNGFIASEYSFKQLMWELRESWNYWKTYYQPSYYC